MRGLTQSYSDLLSFIHAPAGGGQLQWNETFHADGRLKDLGSCICETCVCVFFLNAGKQSKACYITGCLNKA